MLINYKWKTIGKSTKKIYIPLVLQLEQSEKKMDLLSEQISFFKRLLVIVTSVMLFVSIF